MDNARDIEEEFRNKLGQRTKGSIAFFSNPQKAERERCVVRAFLRFLGVAFQEDDLKVSQREPIDVAVFEAKFQITEVLDQGRKRHEEYRKRLAELENVSNGDPCEIGWKNPTSIGWGELARLIEGVLGKKTAYQDIDLLVHIALGQKFLNVKFKPTDLTKIASSGWRSVSFVFPPYSIVLYASDLAPDFLKANVGLVCNKWKSPEGWYESATTKG
jgi:hypothetical protein